LAPSKQALLAKLYVHMYFAKKPAVGYCAQQAGSIVATLKLVTVTPVS